jgi:hypothetical protein
VSHCAIGLEIDGVPSFLHAAVGGVHITSLADMEKNHKIVYVYEILPDISDEVPNALKLIGEDYDYVGLFGFIPVLIARWFKFKLQNPLASKSAVICSEFVIHLDPEGKIPEWVGLNPTDVTPEDLHQVCESGPSFKKLM